MTTPTFDAEGYPTEATLAAIETWSVRDVAGCLDYARAAWHWPDFAHEVLTAHEAGVLRAEPGERYVRFATGGWSGNEEIITALRTNGLVWALTWRLSTCGGLHIFEYPEPRSGALADGSSEVAQGGL
jgi:hypothetical protein